MKVLVLIPAFNEEPKIAEVVRGARNQVPDVLVVDDGSADGTASTAANAGSMVHRLDRNRGKGEALKIGFAYALERGYDWVITLDGDGQHNAGDIAVFLPLLERFDLILGNRMGDSKSVPGLRLMANRTANFMVSRVCGIPILDSQTGFRAYNAGLLRRVGLDCSRYDLETEVVIKAARQGFRIGHCRIQTIYADEVSRFGNVRDSVRFLKVVAMSLFRR